MLREIHSRAGNGITVTLLAELDGSKCSEILATVFDENTGEDFVIRDIPPEKALEVFYHPFASGHSLLVAGRLPQ